MLTAANPWHQTPPHSWKMCQTFSAKQSCQGHKFEFCAWCFLALIDMVEVKVHLKITDNMCKKNGINPHLRLL